MPAENICGHLQTIFFPQKIFRQAEIRSHPILFCFVSNEIFPVLCHYTWSQSYDFGICNYNASDVVG
jgi:hypothetical protein